MQSVCGGDARRESLADRGGKGVHLHEKPHGELGVMRKLTAPDFYVVRPQAGLALTLPGGEYSF